MADSEAFERFKENPGIGTYLAWVRSSYSQYGDVIEEKDLGVGSDVAALVDASKDVAESQARKLFDGAINVGIQVSGLSLDLIRGLGSALVDGVDSAYDTVRDKLRGKEPDVIAAITIGFLSILTVRYLYKAVGRGPAGSD